jgi:hypothetical protein
MEISEMIKRKPPTQVPESSEPMDYGFLKNTELTDFFKDNLHKITSVKYLEDIIKFKVGFDLSRKVVNFSPDLKTGGLCANQVPNEIASFLFHILTNRYRIDRYMEVGVNMGGTFYLIDSFLRATNPNYAGAVAVDKKNVLLDYGNYFKKYPATKILVGDSKRMVISEKFDLIFIDGDHTYLGAKADYLNFKSCTDFMAFHDVEILHRSTNVKKLWEEIKKEYPNNTMEFFNKSPEFQTTLGIGVLIKNQPKVMA